jgi:hypothetical protein
VNKNGRLAASGSPDRSPNPPKRPNGQVLKGAKT